MSDATTKWCPIEYIYPIGSIYTSFNPTNPEKLFNFGKWEEIVDRFLFCSKLNVPSRKTGGSSTHTLTIDEMPSHNHKIYYASNGGTDNSWGYSYAENGAKLSNSYDAQQSTGMANRGGGQPFSIMPPYITVYAWYRSA